MILTQRRRHLMTWAMLWPVLLVFGFVLGFAGLFKGLALIDPVVHDQTVPAVDQIGGER